MAKFNLADAVDVLEYDFRTDQNPEAAHGIIPEPSSQQLSDFRTTMATLIPVQIVDGKPKVDLAALAEQVRTAEEGSDLETSLYQAVADLCSETPSVDDLKALPYRGQRAFVGWIVGTFVADPQSAPATKS